MSNYAELRTRLVKALAKFIAGDQAAKSISLQVEGQRKGTGLAGLMPSWGREWVDVRSAVPIISGYPSVEEAEELLAKFLGVLMEPKPLLTENCTEVSVLDNALIGFNDEMTRLAENDSDRLKDESLAVIRIQVDQLRRTIGQVLHVTPTRKAR
jgi:hypothetical protein